MSADSRLTFKFMNRRNAGAADLPPGAICVDWGDRNEGTYFDHHGLTEATCSTALVNSAEGWKRLRQIVQEKLQDGQTICVVTHAGPDLDSVASTCAVARAMRKDGAPLHPEIVQYVLAKDQGIEVGEDPVKSIALLFQTLKNLSGDDDVEVMQNGIALMEALDRAVRTRSFSPGWNDPADLPGLPIDTISLQNTILDCRRELRGLLAHAPRLLLACPTSDAGKREFSWVDGCILDLSRLEAEPLGWKEYVRHDIHGSMHGCGFDFMAVISTKRGRDNFIASIDPRLGMSLAGLGAQLEAAENRESERLMEKANRWDERLEAIAADRAGGGAPTLLRDEISPRQGFANSDPWYDGRGHGFTIVDTPESGSVLDRNMVLRQILSLYDPLWRETVEEAGTRLDFAEDQQTDACPKSTWLRAGGCPGYASSAAVDSNSAPVLAELLNALLHAKAQSPFAAYAPVTPCPPQLLPQSNPLLHLHLALYLAMHGLPANSPHYPDLSQLQQWVDEFTWKPLPGIWCTVSERGAIMIDYVSETCCGESEIFRLFKDGYFALIRQLEWTSTLSPVIRSMKRYEAFREFVRRNTML